MLVGCPRLRDLLFEGRASRIYFDHLVLLHDALVLLIDQSGLRIEIGDAVAVLDFHGLAPNRGLHFDQRQGGVDLGNGGCYRL